MKSIEERANEYSASKLGWPNPMVVDAYLAGAAAMAEMFASGQALRVERLPGKYFVKYAVLPGSRSGRYQVCKIVSGYTQKEATDGGLVDLINRYETQAVYIEEVRPATDQDTESEKEIV